MPSRWLVGLILLFWLGTVGHIAYRDLWPRLFGDVPPTVAIELIDEATQRIPTRWTILRGDEQIGTLTSQLEYVGKNDTFRYVNTYSNVTFKFDKIPSVGELSLHVPKLDVVIRVNREGQLQEQSVRGTLELHSGEATLYTVNEYVIQGVVEDGVLVGDAKLKSPLFSIERKLEPVPVPQGQVLNPMMPLNRLERVTPGQRWVIREVNPLRDAVGMLVQELAKKAPVVGKMDLSGKAPELIAEVADDPVTIQHGNELIECWLIEYRKEKVVARTWVSIADGRVMRQEAINENETLRFERQD